NLHALIVIHVSIKALAQSKVGHNCPESPYSAIAEMVDESELTCVRADWLRGASYSTTHLMPPGTPNSTDNAKGAGPALAQRTTQPGNGFFRRLGEHGYQPSF